MVMYYHKTYEMYLRLVSLYNRIIINLERVIILKTSQNTNIFFSPIGYNKIVLRILFAPLDNRMGIL